jgi:hypothetical protein
MRAEMASQEAQWKEAYDVLLAENNALKSTGSEALMASQWRQRYEACLKEKEECESKLKMEAQQVKNADAGKYEVKYRDLKESFRLYRRTAERSTRRKYCIFVLLRSRKVCTDSPHMRLTTDPFDEIL